MVLRVDLERFPEEVSTRLGLQDVYVARVASGVVATAADSEKGLVIAASSMKSLEEVRTYLSRSGLRVATGAWDTEGEEVAPGGVEAWVASVAYRTAEAKPGLWVDAFPEEPTPAEVLMRLFDEFRETGEIGDVAFEEFMKVAVPTVVVVGPDELRRYVERNSPSEDAAAG
ncbi:MAG: hypothetical protein K1X67_25235 [Fimbriimonadaceae bacterium]|nr:hypothetical protein [Fimbriimonadaceae bacterium]